MLVFGILFIVLCCCSFLIYYLINRSGKMSLSEYIDSNKEFQGDQSESTTFEYYTQRFTSDIEDLVIEKEVSLDEARKIIDDFYGSGFNPGDIFIIGFSKSEDAFIEFSKNDSGKVSMIRITTPDEYVVEEQKVDFNSAVQVLELFWNKYGNQ